MAAGAWQFYNTFKEYMGDATIDLDNDAFKMLLVTSSYTFAATHSTLANITNELSGNGYARFSLTCTWVLSGGTVTFTYSPNATFTAAGGSITARRAVIFDDTPTSPADPLVCSALLDNTPADVTVTDTNTLTVAAHASGVFTLS